LSDAIAVELAARSGAKHLLATTQATGNLLYLTGDYESALQYQQDAIKTFLFIAITTLCSGQSRSNQARSE
jgi:hypothetical protein